MIAISRIPQTGRLDLTRKREITKPATINSIIKTGKTGGAIGGIPVNSQDTVGDKIAMSMIYRHFRNMLPIIIGINIGKNVGPRPMKWKN